MTIRRMRRSCKLGIELIITTPSWEIIRLAHTSSSAMHLVLDEPVHEWYNGSKEARSDVLSQPNRGRVRRAQGNAAGSPRNSADKVNNHDNIMKVVVVGTRDICEASAGQCANKTNGDLEFGESIDAGPLAGEDIPQGDESEARA